jgi:hypothetical protein
MLRFSEELPKKRVNLGLFDVDRVRGLSYNQRR